MATRMQLRRGTAAAWTSADPILAQGEMGLETDTGFLKIGDGSTAWTALSYFSSGAGGSSETAVTFVLGNGVDVTTGTNKTNEITIPYDATITKAFIRAKTGPTGADLIVDINLNGTSIWAATQANRLKITAGGTTGTQTSFDSTALVEGDVLTIDLDQVGSTVAGQTVTVTLLMEIS